MVHRLTQRGCVLVIAVAMSVGAAAVLAQQGPGEVQDGPAVVSSGATVRDAESKPLGAPKESAKPTASAPSGGVADFARTAISLAGVVALAVFASLVVRRIARASGGLGAAIGAGGRSPAGVMEVLGRYPIARGQTLVLLKLDRRVLLLSHAAGARSGGGGVSCLTEITDPDEVASLLMRTRDADSVSLASRFEESMGRAEREAVREDDEIAEPAPTRRTTISPSGDRAELLNGGGSPRMPHAATRGYSAPAPKVPAAGSPHDSRPDVDAAAEVLRKRLHLLNDPKRGEA